MITINKNLSNFSEYSFEQDCLLGGVQLFVSDEYEKFTDSVETELRPNDPFEKQVRQIVISALTIEFGDNIVNKTSMIETLTESILLDSEKSHEIQSMIEGMLQPRSKETLSQTKPMH